MTNTDFSYYHIEQVDILKIPRLMENSNIEPNGCDFLEMDELAPENEPVHLQFKDTKKYSKIDTDYYKIDNTAVFSKRTVDALSSKMPIKGLQFVPASITDPKNKKTYKDYYYLHNYNEIDCLDRAQSEYSGSKVGIILSISKMTLDTDALAEIPLDERLIMRLGELTAHQLFHKSIVDAIMATNPRGIRFVKVEDYRFGSAFD